MCRWGEVLLGAALALGIPAAHAASPYAGIGRHATPAEVKAWDIDVRPDFKGLPPGSGSVQHGADLWDAKCASCHGDFGDSNEVFTPIIGGVTKDDIARGRVKSLTDPDVPRTTLMKLSTLSTLWDYINRAMPWNAPKSLTTDEVYALTAYILNMGGIVPDDFVLSDRNIAEVQQRLPNRNGMTRDHGLWDIKGKPDVHNTACMKDCATEVRITSSLPDYARGTHGDLAAQNRLIGPVRGQHIALARQSPAPGDPSGKALAARLGCLACHGQSQKIVGPAFSDVAARYQHQDGAASVIAARVRSGGSGVWGSVPMPPHPDIKDDEVAALAKWILSGAK